MAALWLICLGFVTTVAMLYVGKLDIRAAGQSRIQRNGRSKVVQPFEPGRVVSITVENGGVVDAGAVRLELDATETGADRKAQVQDLEAMSAEIARRRDD